MNQLILDNIKRIESVCFYPIYYYENDNLLYFPRHNRHMAPLLCDSALFSKIYDTPGISKDHSNNDIFYFTQKYSDGSTLLIGPCSLYAIHKDVQRQYCQTHHIPEKFSFPIARASVEQVSNIIHLFNDLFLSCNIQPLSLNTPVSILPENLYENKTEKEITNIDYYNYQQHLDTDSELNLVHTPYSIELKLIHALQMGDENSMNYALCEMYQFDPGNFAASSTKAVEYGSIMMISTFTRAVIEAGVLPDDAYTLSDLLSSEVSKSSSIEQYQKIYSKIFSSYLYLIKQRKQAEETSPYINKCKSYIIHHLNQPLSPDILAQNLHISTDYLQHLFSSQENTTLMDYVRQTRMEAAANMLKYSDFSIQRIAEYYQFKTQTHFGVIFKKYMGMTPSAYRKLHKPENF